jgi:hypothetical protein
MSRKGKCRTSPGRRDLQRSLAANARRRTRQARKGYDKQAYDGHASEVQ